MTAAITVEILDALLSPAPAAGGRSPREQAEAHLGSMSVNDRASGLLSLLLELHMQPGQGQGQDKAHNQMGRQMMASVLLRRTVAILNDSSRLEDMLGPCLALFVADESKSISHQCQRQVGHCLAEICANLSILSAAGSDEAIKTILTRIAPAVRTFILK